MNPSPDRIFAALRACRGSENAITSRRLCDLLKIPRTMERTLRRIIQKHRAEWPEFIASTSRGFFVPVDFEEIEAHIDARRRFAASVDGNLAAALDHARRQGFRFKARQPKHVQPKKGRKPHGS